MKKGLPEFSGTKLAHDTGVCATFKDVHKVEIEDQDQILVKHAGRVGSGGNSGFQALNLAIQFGAVKVVLIGFDMHGTHGAHWYGRNTGPGMNNPADANYKRWREAFGRQSGILRALGVEVINASPDSALRCFEQRSLEETLTGWGV